MADHTAELQEAGHEENVVVEREAHEDGEGHGLNDVVDAGRLRQTWSDALEMVLPGPEPVRLGVSTYKHAITLPAVRPREARAPSVSLVFYYILVCSCDSMFIRVLT